MATVKEELGQYASRVETYLSDCLKNRGIPERLLNAMEYSLMAGGKRLRPVLCLTWAQLFGTAEEAIMPFASSLELIHSYSLIHDDLPAMDDDDLRRGKPSNHMVYGEAGAILAGDGLLTEAFGLMFRSGESIDPALVLRASDVVSRAAGAAGMVGGQIVDIDFTGRDDVELPELQQMHAMKTGALIRCACESGAILSGTDEVNIQRAISYGKSIGVAFQIVDDVLDIVADEEELGKPVGSDEEQGKVTYPSLVGLDESKRLADEHISEALACIEPFNGPEADFLRKLARYIVERVY